MSVETTRRGDLVGAALAVAMSVLFACVVIVGKGLLHGEPPFTLLCLRFGLTAALVAVVAIATGQPLVPEPGERLGLALAGLFGYGTESALYWAGLNHGTAASVTLLFYLYPVWVMLAASMLDRRVPAGAIVLAVGMALAGGAVVIVGGSGIDIEPAGIALALGCSVAYTAYLVATDRIAVRTTAMTTGLWVAAGASVANLTYALGDAFVDASGRRPRGAAGARDGRVHGRRVHLHDVEPPADRRRPQRHHRRHRTAHRRRASRAVPERADHRFGRARRRPHPGAGVLATVTGRPRTREPDI